MRSLRALAARLGCPFQGEYLFERAEINSRVCGPSTLFFALAGRNTDGHRFVHDVLGNGGAAVVSRDGFTGPVLEVDSVQEALMEAGAWVRDELTCPVVAVTGSSGKTTTSRMLAIALSTRYRTWSTRGNLNNHLGLPLTLLNTPAEAETVVLEMGMNHSGELLRLGWAARPQLSLITNIGSAHMEFLGSREGIAMAKAEILQRTEEGGTAIIPFGEDILYRTAMEHGLETITHGPGGDCRMEGNMAMPWGVELRPSMEGEHNLSNALAALACACRLGADPESAAVAIAGLSPGAGRGEVLQLDGIRVVDESYNANPESTKACLITAAQTTNGPLTAVLGDMLELGENSLEIHIRMIETALNLGYRDLIVTGSWYSRAAESFSANECLALPGWREALQAVRSKAVSGATILVKGSNSIELWRLVDELKREGF